MPKTLARKLLVLALLVIAVTSWRWLDDRSSHVTAEVDPINTFKTDTDYFLQGFEIDNIDTENGQNLHLTGESLAHYTDNGQSRIVNPDVTLNTERRGYWHGIADNGTLSADFKRVKLEGNVALRHLENSASPSLLVTTDSLNIDSDRQLLHTENQVDVKSDQWSFSATGMRADLANGLLIFPSNVEARYEQQIR